MADQLLSMLHIEATVSEPLEPTGDTWIMTHYFDPAKVCNDLQGILARHGYELRILGTYLSPDRYSALMKSYGEDHWYPPGHDDLPVALLWVKNTQLQGPP